MTALSLEKGRYMCRVHDMFKALSDNSLIIIFCANVCGNERGIASCVCAHQEASDRYICVHVHFFLRRIFFSQAWHLLQRRCARALLGIAQRCPTTIVHRVLTWTPCSQIWDDLFSRALQLCSRASHVTGSGDCIQQNNQTHVTKLTSGWPSPN